MTHPPTTAEALKALEIMIRGAEDCLRLKQAEAIKGHDWVVTNQVYGADTIIGLKPILTALSSVPAWRPISEGDRPTDVHIQGGSDGFRALCNNHGLVLVRPFMETLALKYPNGLRIVPLPPTQSTGGEG